MSEDMEVSRQEEEKQPFIPSPTWKRVGAWILFGIVILGIITWLLNMAFPQWIDGLKTWAKDLIGL